MPAAGFEPADDARARVDGGPRYAAVTPRVQVDRGAGSVKLDVEEPPQSRGQGRAVGLIESAVPDKHRVRLQFRPVGAQILGEGFARDLLLALDQEANVERRSTRGEEVLDGLERGHVVALVVGRATGVDVPVSDRGLEGW